MMLHPLIHHMENPHWTKVFIDLVIVVPDVFTGLQPDHWNRARIQRAVLAGSTPGSGVRP